MDETLLRGRGRPRKYNTDDPDERKRISIRKYYEENKEVLNEKSKERYRRKKEEMGGSVRPSRGRPLKYPVVKINDLIFDLDVKEHKKIECYQNLIRQGKIPDIKIMSSDDRNILVLALLFENNHFQIEDD